MILTSSSFEHNSFIPKKFSAEGGNINPELTIQNVPEEAKSLALILHDPDAPVPGGFTHWVVCNIDSRTTVIKQESVPPGGVEGTRGGGKGLGVVSTHHGGDGQRTSRLSHARYDRSDRLLARMNRYA